MPETRVILLAEDDDDQIFLIRRAFKQACILNPLHVVHNGEEAIAYLKGVDQYANRAEYPLPSLLLLDLRMPRISGFEVLQWIRDQHTLRPLRVIVLTSSRDLHDVNEAYQLGANSFLVKPTDFDNFRVLVQSLQCYWIQTDQSPEVARPDEKTSEVRERKIAAD